MSKEDDRAVVLTRGRLFSLFAWAFLAWNTKFLDIF